MGTETSRQRESPDVRRTPQWAHGGRTQGYSCISGKGHWQGTWEGTHSIEEEDRGNLGSGTLFPCPGHTPLRGPQRPSRKGPWALWMDSGLVVWLQEPTPNRSCAQVWGAPISAHPGPPQTSQGPLSMPPSVFLLDPCHCANTEVFFGDGTRLTVVGKRCSRSFGPLVGNSGSKLCILEGSYSDVEL